MESTELQDIDFYSSFYDHTNSTFFTPTTSSLPSDSVSEGPVLPKQANDEEDEYVAELTRQMTNYMLQDDHKHQKSCGGGGSGSPQSTLWSPFASGNSSPVGPSREPTPPLTPVTVESKPVMVHSQSKQVLIDDQIRSIQANFHKIKKEKDTQRNDDVVGHKARNYQHQQKPRSGVKAVFVDGSGSRTGSGGTGVFLPRCHGTVMEYSRKKSGCSTIIIPARVVEALKVHFDKLGVPSTFSSDIPPFHDALLVSMKNKNIKSSSSTRAQSVPLYTSETTSVESHQEPLADLPHEWTY